MYTKGKILQNTHNKVTLAVPVPSGPLHRGMNLRELEGRHLPTPAPLTRCVSPRHDLQLPATKS